jgi:flagellin
MSIVVNSNINSLMSQNYLTTNQAGLSQAMQRLSSGLRINSASDDPAGLAVGTSMAVTAAALAQGARNGNDGISLAQTAEGAMSDISNLLTTMSTIATQAANGVYSSTQLGNLSTTFKALLGEVSRVADSTQFNGITLLDGTSSSVSIQVGSGTTAQDRLTINLSNLTISSLSISSLDVTTQAKAQTAMSTLSKAINTVTTALSDLGANQTNLSKAVDVDNILSAALGAAKSRVMDADFAAESGNLARYNILNQSNIAMLAQANSSPQMVLQLLRG